MEASVIIPIYQRTTWIDKCIEKLNNQTFKGQFEILVVDDGSPDGQVIKNKIENTIGKSRLRIRFFQNIHAGPAAARNKGARKAVGRILCFLDDDSMPDPQWLEEILNTFEKKISVALVSGKILSYDRQPGLSLLLEKYVYPRKSWATCNIAYKRETFEKLQGFDERFPHASWEDNDLGLRAMWEGYSHVHNNNAIVYHPHEATLEEYKEKCLANGRGAAVFSRKYIVRKPIWGIGVFFVMSRRLVNIISPSVWKKDESSGVFLNFIWSLYSAIGFINSFILKNEKN